MVVYDWDIVTSLSLFTDGLCHRMGTFFIFLWLSLFSCGVHKEHLVCMFCMVLVSQSLVKVLEIKKSEWTLNHFLKVINSRIKFSPSIAIHNC